ncbi:hypothetical protein, partial [Nocardiopsis lucentensis]|uniref:hypothetical protein n=1 Tax=Nocardiopsis lucentensis TaxID=53441 RepID=UPI000593C6BF
SDATSVPRRTAADLEEAEAAALARRRGGAQRTTAPEPDGSPAPALDPRANRSLAGVLAEEGAASPTAQDGTDRAVTDTGTDRAAPEGDTG